MSSSPNQETPRPKTAALRTHDEPPIINTLERLRAAFDAADHKQHPKKEESPRVQSIKFSQAVAVVPQESEEHHEPLPFPNQFYKPRKGVLKKREMSNCSSFYSCDSKSDYNDFLTTHNTMINSGNVKLRRMHTALAVKIMRRRSLGMRDDEPSKLSKRKSSLIEIRSSDIVRGIIPPREDEPKPEPPKYPIAGPGHDPDVALVKNAGKVAHPDDTDSRHVELKRQLQKMQEREQERLRKLAPHKRKPPPKPQVVQRKVKTPESKPHFTLAMVARNGSLRLCQRKDGNSENGSSCTHKGHEQKKKSPEMKVWDQYPKIDFENTDFAALTKYAVKFARAMAFQELQFQIPAEQHARKMEALERKADELHYKFHRKVYPERKVSRARKLGESVTDPFGIMKYKKLLQANAKTGNGILNVKVPDTFPPVEGPHVPRNYEPRNETLSKVNDWLKRPTHDALSLNPSTPLWLQPLITKHHKQIVDNLPVRKFFNVLDGRVVYPFYDATVSNSFCKRHTPEKKSLALLVKQIRPTGKFKTKVPLGGFQNREITFEYKTNVIYISARTLTMYATEKCKRRYEGTVQIPAHLMISDLEYSRDQHGILFIDELPDSEKRMMDENNHVYAHESRSIHKIYT